MGEGFLIQISRYLYPVNCFSQSISDMTILWYLEVFLSLEEDIF